MNNDGKRTVNIGVIAVIGLIVVFVALLAAFIILASGLNVPKGEQLEKPSDVEKKVGTTVEQDNGKKVEETSVINETTEKTEPDDPVTMYVANVENSVYFRSEPKEADSNIMTTIPVGTAVSFLQNEGATFAKIKYNGQTGYVKRDYLSHSVPKQKEKIVYVDNSIKSYKYVVNVPNSVYLRKGPSSNSGYYTTIPLGEMVGFIEVSNNTYSKVSYNGQIGYVTSKYLGDYYSEPSSDNYMTVYNVKAAIYLRSEPVEKSGNIICEIPVGSKVKYLDSGNGTFYRISWNGMTGYSKAKYLTW